MPKFKENTGFKMKGPSLYPKTHGSSERNSYTSPFKQVKGKDRPDPTWPGTDEYRKEKDIPAAEYSARGISKDDRKKKRKDKKILKKSNRKLIKEQKVKLKQGKTTKKQFKEAKKEIKGYTDVDAAKDHLAKQKKATKGPLYQKKTKEQLLNEGFSQVEADQMMKTGATTGEQPSERKTAMSNNAKILQRRRREQLKKSANKLAKKGLKKQLKEGTSEFAKGKEKQRKKERKQALYGWMQ